VSGPGITIAINFVSVVVSDCDADGGDGQCAYYADVSSFFHRMVLSLLLLDGEVM
jgi:hypothetical protein